MSENSKIEWTMHTFNPWWGCTHVHEGCRNCYAETWANRFGVKWGPSGVRRLSSDSVWKQPLKWNRAAQKAGVRAKVFCSSMADVFEDWTGPIVDCKGQVAYRFEGGIRWHSAEANVCGELVTLGDIRSLLFELIDETPWLDWQLLTKRPENIRRMWPVRVDSKPIFPGMPGPLGQPSRCIVQHAHRQNVWLGTSISDQASADKQIPELLKCRDLAAKLFLSCEPLLGPVDIIKPMPSEDQIAIGRGHPAEIDWVIVGGESGPGARPMHPDWARSLRDQCIAAEVPFFFKQWGEWAPATREYGIAGGVMPNSGKTPEGTRVSWIGYDGQLKVPSSDGLQKPVMAIAHIGKEAAGRLLDGREWSEFPI